MAIPVTCQCGKSFNAKPELAGRRVTCPACGSPLQIPAMPVPSRDDDPPGLGGFDEQVFSPAPRAGVPIGGARMPSSSYTSAARQSRTSSGSSKKPGVKLAMMIGGFAIGGVLVTCVVVAVLVAAFQGARESARRWVEYESADGSYTVSMPQQPQTRMQSAATPAGTVTINIAMVDLGRHGAYMVSYNKLPATSELPEPDALLKDGVIRAMQNINGSIRSEESITLFGHPGKEVVFDGQSKEQPLTGSSRFVVTDHILYQLVWIGPPGQLPDNVQRFFDSFQITPRSKTDTPTTTPQVSASTTTPPTLPTPDQATAGDPDELTEQRRKHVYRDAVNRDRAVESLLEHAERVEDQGHTVAASQARESAATMRANNQKNLLDFHRITEHQLDEIRREGKANGW
ncbi:MAG: hypothetical protein HYV60_01885 [Planctomycetia bacterium]|nr:hypothetical protein [Planctomycetia bacterium]